MRRFFQPAPPAPVTLTDPAAIAAEYRRWQTRVLFFSIIGYATFYFVRKNYSVVQPIIGRDLGISKQGLGLILTLHGRSIHSAVATSAALGVPIKIGRASCRERV